MAPPARFCPQCGVSLDDPLRCASCAWIQYRDPKLAVVVLVSDDAGRLLYVRRNHEPAMYRWAWPSGYVDAGERVEGAAAREVREETSIEIELRQLLGVWSRSGDDVVALAYTAVAIGGELRPGPEAFAAGWWPREHLPPTVFPHDAEIIAAYQRQSD